MNRTLVILLADTGPVTWAAFDDRAMCRVGLGEAAESSPIFFPDGGRPARVWAVAPGQHVLSHIVDLPVQNESQARRSLPFLMEDDVAADAEDQHFVLGRALPEGRRLAAVVSKAKMDEWLGALKAVNAVPNVVIPDYMVAAAGDQAIAEFKERAIVASGEGGFTIERDMLPYVLPGTETAHRRELQAADILESAYRALSGPARLNLLQGPYAPRRSWPAALSAWKRAAALAGMAAALGLMLQMAEGLRLNREAERAYARAEAVFRDSVPEVTRVVNPRAQIKAKVEELRASSSFTFLRLVGLLADGIAETAGAEIDAMRFDGARGELAASVSLVGYGDIAQVKSRIESRGGRINEGTARQAGARILADVVVRLP